MDYLPKIKMDFIPNEEENANIDAFEGDKEIIKEARDNHGNWEVSDSEEEEISVVEMFRRKDGGLSKKTICPTCDRELPMEK